MSWQLCYTPATFKVIKLSTKAYFYSRMDWLEFASQSQRHWTRVSDSSHEHNIRITWIYLSSICTHKVIWILVYFKNACKDFRHYIWHKHPVWLMMNWWWWCCGGRWKSVTLQSSYLAIILGQNFMSKWRLIGQEPELITSLCKQVKLQFMSV